MSELNRFWVIVDVGQGRVLNKQVSTDQSMDDLLLNYSIAVNDRKPILFHDPDHVTCVVPCKGMIVTVMTEEKYQKLKLELEAQQQRMQMMGVPIGLPPGFPSGSRRQ